MPTREEYLELWGEDNTVAVPLAEWKSESPAPPESWPEVDLLPIDMSVAFTAYLDGEYDPFHRIEHDSRTYVVLGKVPQEPKSTFFVLSLATGAVHLVNPPDGTPAKLNSSFATFVRFLHRFAEFVTTDDGLATRPARAEELERDLKAIDPAAFDHDDSPWNTAVSFLKTDFQLR
ncbi:SUKH-4 family immunity protein [Actinomadura algeriensis]|uniref:SUKH-4 immunity protein of toxin-antitoxin system n=1 Tax=Actinomadura algeriensis TaxID=1679523 RepID=A0ABR9JPG6_9ACTN|nr:SUKH-4 family immunity protein [Actinomadura algeriensis]MBE1532463.1 hypothetical protein [Actinomadura algeriensis]